MMGERRGRPVAAFLIGLVAVPGGIASAVVAVFYFGYGGVTIGAWLVVTAALTLFGGLWVARWVGTGFWALRPSAGGEAPVPAVSGHGRRGRPVMAAVVVVLAVFYMGFLVADGVTTFSGYTGSYEFGGTFSVAPRHGAGVLLLVAAGVVGLVGLWLAWRVGSGRWGPRRRPTAPADPPAPGAGGEGGGDG